METTTSTATDLARGAVAEVGRARALLWAVGLLLSAREWGDVRKVGMVVRASAVATNARAR